MLLHDLMYHNNLLDTTRSPRAGEVPDVSYHFVPKEDFIALKDANGFIETACFSGNMYGTSKAAVEAVTSQNRICVLDVEIQGVRSIKKTDMNAIYVFISPPSFEVLEERLRGRKTETEESIAKRMEAARHDLKAANDEKLFDIYITNDELERALQDLEAFLISKYGGKLSILLLFWVEFFY